jgi:hypothetical protein
MITAVRHPEPFGIATITNDLASAKEFYTRLYPYEVSKAFSPASTTSRS